MVNLLQIALGVTDRLHVAIVIDQLGLQHGVNRHRMREVIGFKHINQEVDRSERPQVVWLEHKIESLPITIIDRTSLLSARVLKVIHEDDQVETLLQQTRATEESDLLITGGQSSPSPHHPSYSTVRSDWA